MADDWKPGDRALCVNDKGWQDLHGVMIGPAAGSVSTVADVVVSRCVACLDIHQFLGLAEWRLHGIYDAAAFTKIASHERDAEDEETIRLLNGAPAIPDLVEVP